MPFTSYSSSAASARHRRAKDKEKETRTTPSTTSGRRQRDQPRPGSRSSTPNSQTPQQSLYNQPNVTLEQLPPLPSSGTVSPSSSASPVLRASQVPNSSGGVFQLATQPYTPASLQPYLQDETSDHDLNPGPEEPRRASAGARLDTREVFDQPTSTTVDHLPAISQQLSKDSASFRSSPPPPVPESPSISHRQVSPALSAPLPVAPIPLYPVSPQPISPVLHFRGAIPSEHYYASPYPGLRHYAMEQPIGHATEYSQPLGQRMPFFPGYGSPQPVPAAFNSIMSPAGQGQAFPGPRTNMPGEILPNVAQASAEIGERAGPDSGAPLHLGPEDDAVDLLHRIQSAIPDLHLLLNRYRETSGQLGVREHLIRQTEAQKAEALSKKEAYIEKLGKELETISHKHSSESSKLRLEIGNLEEKHKELQDSLMARKKSRDELEAANLSLQRENELMREKSQDEKESVTRDFARWKEDILKDFEVKQKAMNDELERLQKSETAQKDRVVDIQKRHDQDIDILHHGWTREKSDLEAIHNRTRQNLENTIQNRQRELDEARRKECDSQEAWARERDALVKGWEVERTRLYQDWEVERLGLITQQGKEREETERSWRESQEQQGRRGEVENERLKREIEKLKSDWDADKTKFNKVSKELKAVAGKLDDENSNLQKMIEAFGEATDFKSRGDAYFIDAFKQLHKQISELAVEHSRDISEQPPEHILRRVPSHMPDFLSNSDAAMELRATYVEHVISRILTQQIFQPFLFTLGRRNDSADQLFQTMSQKLRQKSIRRESLWRQHTLHAAYTVSSAKQSINKVAALIVEEIMDEIRYFTCPNQHEQVTVAVRRIVKVAAETWRYARLEREMVIASMSPEQYPTMFGSYQRVTSASRSTRDETASTKVVLPLIPFIEREPAHEDLRPSSNQDDQGCVYSSGVALFTNSPVVLARLAELQEMNIEHTLPEMVPKSRSRNHIRVQDPTHSARAVLTQPQESPMLQDGELLPQQASRQHVYEDDRAEGLKGSSVPEMAHNNRSSGQHRTRSQRSQTQTSRTTLMPSSDQQSPSTANQLSEAMPKLGATSEAAQAKRPHW